MVTSGYYNLPEEVINAVNNFDGITQYVSAKDCYNKLLKICDKPVVYSFNNSMLGTISGVGTVHRMLNNVSISISTFTFRVQLLCNEKRPDEVSIIVEYF